MSHSTLTLVVTGLQSSQLKPTSVLAKWTKSANSFDVAEKSSQLLCNLFDLHFQDEVPVAALTGLAQGLETENGGWLRADPVDFLTDWAGIYLLGNEHLILTPDEVANYVAFLNAFLIEDKIKCFAPSSRDWYFQLSQPPEIKTYDLNEMVHKEISHFLPTGKRQQYWRKLNTEIQMLLHASELNQQRQTQQKPLVQSLWFWGGGELPPPTATQWKKVWSNNLLAQGLAKLNGLVWTDKCLEAEPCLAQMTATGNYLVVLQESEESLALLENTWFDPLFQALKSRQLEVVQLYLGDGRCHRISSSDLQPWWRKFFK